ncbi:MAG: molecular chaperone DnaK [Candidatus Portnoybacteria bacterium CG11_big_fil_rev_8_21_14_0_20_44_10]|uniref:Chaperone protein DnaK n=1 Tax=Candidatus Portnoybacteria bacterium CG11_big_fil_rev_8_21_14_0_20_44_10 TaxID=1974818 RepID=A0A2H0KQV6_9BACT|nr:MAG: molecular chaperone DnaK [Candidatus Portnoybacteria bacterium CG11_big_fil_rev_8_21_14_0_20_44_10]
MSKIIGIDLGTSNSAAAVVEAGKPIIIPSAEGTTVGGKAFPSYVAFTKEGELLIGEPARRQAVTNPERTITAIKRKMGTDYKVKINDPSTGSTGSPQAGSGQVKEYTPQQISAFILQKIKRDAEAYLGDRIEKAVITVPAYFNDAQRQATKDAGAIAGLEVIRIINEPTAAALAYGVDKTGKEEKILVFDFGGGTLDCTIMDFGEGVFEVLSTSGDTELGGTDMDEVLVNFILGEFKKDSGIDVSKDKMAMTRLKEAAEKAKIELSSTLETDINLPFITADAAGPKHLMTKITRAKLEELVGPIVEKCRGPLEQAISDAKLAPGGITKIILVGGPTRMPIVQKFVEDYIVQKAERGVDPMECVAMGAAIQAAVLSGEMKEVLLLDVTPLTLGIETMGGVMTPLIERNTTIPASKTQIFSTASDSQPSVEIHVLQGERPMAPDNRTLGRFILDGIPPAPRGVPQVEVIFDIDANGILKVTAKDKATSRTQNITIKDTSALSKEDIERMRQEAEAHAVDDRKKKELIEIRNQADTLIYSAEKSLKDLGDKVSADIKKTVEEKISAIKKVKDSDDQAAIKSAMDDLSSEIQKIGAQMYQQTQENKKEVTDEPEVESDDSGKKDDKGPIEGEVEEK